ncbi:MAG TPA: hypothetical protein VJ905_06205 [Halalkalibaculum sp.]|nr:hypothetical protein [Halalkalibaculum sp.]
MDDESGKAGNQPWGKIQVPGEVPAGTPNIVTPGFRIAIPWEHSDGMSNHIPKKCR